jgi:hypothetical protein
MDNGPENENTCWTAPMPSSRSKKAYKGRSDSGKVQSQWHKGTGLHGRDEPSAAVVRAATAAELAANFAVRREFKSRSSFDKDVVNKFLKSANGLNGKIERLLIPLTAGEDRLDTIKKLRSLSRPISEMRNRIVHEGEFCSKKEAKEIIEKAREFVETLMRQQTEVQT